MAGSLGDLVVRLKLDAADYTTGLTAAERNAEKFANSTTQALERTNRELKKSSDSLNYFSDGFKKIAAAVGVAEIVRLNDEFSNVSARLKIVTADTEDFARVQKILFETANTTRTAYGATANLFYRLSTATVDLGTNQNTLLTITDKLNKALVISGATGSTAKGALEQLSQALGANQLRGQEFNTVNEQGNRIIRALADGLGKTVGELRDMANEGKITTEVFIRGFLKGAASIDDEFKRVPVTISGALQIAENELQRFVGTTATTTGGSTALASSIVFLAKNIDILAAAAIGFGATKLATVFLENARAATVKTVELFKQTAAQRANNAVTLEAAKAEVARLAATEAAIVAARTQAFAELQATQALIARGAVDKAFAAQAVNNLAQLGAAQAGVAASAVKAQQALAAAQGATTASASVLARAMGFLGGPIGAVATALGLGVAAWQLWGSTAKDQNQDAENATEQSTKSIISNLNKQIEKLRERNRVQIGGDNENTKRNIEAEARASELETKAERAFDIEPGLPDFSQFTELGQTPNFGEAITQATRYREEAKEIRDALKEVNRQQDFLASRQQSDTYAKLLREYANDAGKLEEALRKAREELKLPEGSALPGELDKLIREKFAKKTRSDDPTKKEIEGELRAIEAQIAKEKDILQAREAFLRDTFSEGLLSVEQFYDAESAARADNLQKTIGFYDEELRIAEQFKKRKGATQKEIADADNKIADIKAKSDNAQRDAQRNEIQLNRDRQKAVQEYIDSLNELNAKILEINGNSGQAALIRFDAATRIQRNLLNSSNNTEGIRQLDELRKQAVVQGDLTDATNNYTLVLGYLGLAQANLNDLRSVGAKGEISYLKEASALNVDYLGIMTQLADQYARIAEQSKNPADLLKARQMQQAVEQLSRQTDLLADKFNNILGDAFSDNLTALVTGAKSLQDAVKDFGKQVNDQVVKNIANEFQAKLFGQGGVLSGIGEFFSDLLGGKNKVSGIAGEIDVSKVLSVGTETAQQTADLAASTALTASATSLTAAGSSLLLGGTELSLSGATLGLAGTSLTTAGVALNTAATALLAATISDTASEGADLLGEFISVLGSVPGNAMGTNYAGGGLSWVGERGPELVNLPVGSRVIPNHKVGMMGGNSPIIIYQTVMPGADTSSFRQKALDAAGALQNTWRNR